MYNRRDENRPREDDDKNEESGQWRSEKKKIEIKRKKENIDSEFIKLIPPGRKTNVNAMLSDEHGQKYTILRHNSRLLCVEKDKTHYIVNFDGTLSPYKHVDGDKCRKSATYDESIAEYSRSLDALKGLTLVGYIKIDGEFQVAVSTLAGIRIINENGDLYEPDSEYEIIDNNAKLFEKIKNMTDREKVLNRIFQNYDAYNIRKGYIDYKPLFESPGKASGASRGKARGSTGASGK